MLQPELRKDAAILVWLQIPALGYLLRSETTSCAQVFCLSSDGAWTWLVAVLPLVVTPVVIGALLWRGWMLGAILAVLLGFAEMAVSALFAVAFYYSAGKAAWVVAQAPLVVPGELAAIAVVVTLAAYLWAPANAKSTPPEAPP